MPVLVFNKRTKKYLKNYGTTYNRLYKLNEEWIKNKDLGKYTPLTTEEVEEKLFTADASSAKQYATVTNARQAVGEIIHTNCRRIPRHLELHRVKEIIVTVEDEPIIIHEHRN